MTIDDKMWRDIMKRWQPPLYVECICGNFSMGKAMAPHLEFYQCENCGGWMSLQRIVDERYGEIDKALEDAGFKRDV